MQFGIGTGLTNNTGFYGVRENNTSVYCTSMWVDSRDTWNTISTYNHFDYEQGQQSHVFSVSSTAKHHGNNPRQLFTVHQNIATWGNDTINFADQYDSSLSDPTLPFAIFGRNMNGVLNPFYTFELFVYNVKLYDSNNVLIHDLRPVERVSDNAAGLYDVLTNKFYGNAGGGSFVKGPVVTTPDRIINAKIGNGLQFDSNNAIEVNTGDGLQINQDGELEIDPSIIPEVTEYEAGEAIEITEVTHGDEFRVLNQEYFFDTRGLTCGLNARVWTTVNDGDILAAMCIHNNGGNQVPLFVGLTEDSVKVSQNYNSTILGPNGSFDYRGKTWYFTADYALSGTDGQDTQGHIQTLPTTYSFNSTPSNFVPAAKDLIDLAVLLSDLEYPAISVKYNKGLTVNQDNELEVNIGTGLEFDQVTGAINVTGGSGGDTVEAGDGIDITTDSQTGNKVISVSPATQNSIGGIKIGDGLSIDEDGVASAKVYEAGQGIVFDEAMPEGQFKVKNLEYYFDNQISCQIDGTYGPRTFTRVSQYEQCLAVIWPRTISGQGWTNPLFVGLTENSVKLTSSADSNILGPSGSFEYKGYTWYYTCTYGLMNSSGVDLLGNLQTMNYTDSTDEVDGSKHLIDLAGLVLYEESIDVWNSGTGWLNGAYNDSQSDQFWTNWYYTYHSKQNEYLEVPAGAIKMRQIGISNENDSRLQGGGVDCFNSSHHHFTTIGCITDEWADIPEDTVYLQFGVKWNELNNRTISSSDIKSVTIEFYYDTPRNDVINAKLGNGLQFDSNDAIQAKLGSGLGFDSNGAIEVTGGSGGDTIAEGDGIEITTDQQTGVKTIGVNVGNGLEIDPITGALNVTGSSGGGSGDYSAGEAIDIRQSTLTNNIDAIRWDISEIKTNGGPWTQVRYVEFCDSSGTAQTLSTGSGIWEDGTAVTYSHDPAGGGSQEITDMIADTRKMCAAWRGPGHTLKLTFILDTATAPSNIVKFRMKTGDDEVGRDPKKWKIYVRDSITQRWYLVHETENAEVTDTRSTWSNYYNFSTPSDTSINVKYGTGLSVDPITNELFVDGQLPEGTIIKKLTYVGDGSTTNSNIHFSKKPLSILSLNGLVGQNYGSVISTPIDAPYLHGVWGGSTGSGTSFRSPMSYDDTTNTLSIQNTSDVGLAFNISGVTYTMFYLTKGHTGSGTSVNNEVSVVKTFSYVGTGTSTNNIQFPETPDMILKISGPLATGDITTAPIEINHPTSNADYMTIYTQHNGGSNTTNVGYGTFSFNDSTNVLTLTGGDYGDALNYSGGTYYVQYVVNEVIASSNYVEGDGIEIDPVTGEISVNIGTGLAFDPQTGAINVTGGGGGSGDTVAEGGGIEITTDQQTGNKVIAVNAGTGLQVDQTTNELEIDDSVVTEDDELNLVFVPDDYQPS